METDFTPIRTAIAKDPYNVALRVHLSDRLIEDQRVADAMAELQAGLAIAPDDVALLGLAERVARRLGLSPLAQRYERTLDALLLCGSVEQSPMPEHADPAATPEVIEPRPIHSVAPTTRELPDVDTRSAEPTIEAHGPTREQPSVVHDLRERSAPESSDDLAELSQLAGLIDESDLDRDDADSAWAALATLDDAAHPDMDFAASDTGRRIIEVRRDSATLDDIVGMSDLVNELESFCEAPLRAPEVRTVLGQSARNGGLLLWGPPGCGKAYFARACGGALRSKVVHVHVTEMVDDWKRRGDYDVASVFAEVEMHSPSVLFLDGIEALSGHEPLVADAVADFAARLDGLLGDSDDVAAIGTTEQPWLLNRPLIAPGRFGTQMLVPPPDRAARAAIINNRLADRSVRDLNTAALADLTEGYTAADLVFVCELATESAIFDSIDSGTIRAITMDDLRDAITERAPSAATWFRSALEHSTRSGAGVVRYDLLHRWLGRDRQE